MAVWLGVVVLYSQSIEIWHALVAAFGKSVAGGTPIALAVLLVTLAAFWGRRLLGGLSWPWAAASWRRPKSNKFVALRYVGVHHGLRDPMKLELHCHSTCSDGSLSAFREDIGATGDHE